MFALKIRLSLAALCAVSALAAPAFAQNLPAPADVPPPAPTTPPAPAPTKSPVPPVIVITDTPSNHKPSDDLIGGAPVRGTGNGTGTLPGTTPTPPTSPPTVSSVGGVTVYGLSDLAALQKLKAAFADKLKADVRLNDGVKTWLLHRDELGATIPYRDLLEKARVVKRDVPLRFEVNLEAAKTAMLSLAERVNRIEQVDGNWMRAQIAVEGSAWRVKEALEAQPPRLNADLVVTRAPSAAPPQEVGAPEGFPHLLAEFSSHYDGRLRGRTKNLILAAKAVNGTIVEDGATFSANKTIGPRNEEDGWKEAKMFVSGQVVSGVGAGICQCSSTIYNAALLAGLPIIERHPHMFRVPYVPASRDAAIYWGGKDFKFKNTSGGPLYIETFLRGGRFHAKLWGIMPRQGEYRVESRTISSKNGTVSEAYRIAKTGDGEKREKLSRDYYKPHP